MTNSQSQSTLEQRVLERYRAQPDTALIVEAIIAACPQLHPAQARMAALNVQKVIVAMPEAPPTEGAVDALRALTDEAEKAVAVAPRLDLQQLGWAASRARAVLGGRYA